jgi:Cu-Zn family superoxide dismutase
MQRGRRILMGALGVVLLVATAPAAFADHGHGSKSHGGKDKGNKPATVKVFTLDPSTHGNPEGVATSNHDGVFFVGATGDGTIYRGTIDGPTATEFIAGGAGKSAIGLKVVRGKLYVAGGGTGKLTVYDLATKQTVASFDTGTGGFLNDLVVTGAGDVFVTDSFRPTLWHVTGAQVEAGGGTPRGIPVGPEIAYEPGAFNLNGIVARKRGRQLIVVQSSNGKLFRIDLAGGTPSRREIRQIDADPLPGGDGLLLDRGRLLVVQGSPAALRFVKLRGDAERGEIEQTRTDPSLRGPSTVARARDLYLVVNADFVGSRKPFTVSGLPREREH